MSGLRRGRWRSWGSRSYGEPYSIVLDAVYSDDKHVATSRSPRNRRDRHCNWEVERRALWGARRAANLKGSADPERLVSGRARDHEGIPVLIINRKLGGMSVVGLVPVHLNHPGNREWMRGWPNLGPSAAQKEEEPLADFCAIREENLSPHVLRGRKPPARRVD